METETVVIDGKEEISRLDLGELARAEEISIAKLEKHYSNLMDSADRIYKQYEKAAKQKIKDCRKKRKEMNRNLDIIINIDDNALAERYKAQIEDINNQELNLVDSEAIMSDLGITDSSEKKVVGSYLERIARTKQRARNDKWYNPYLSRNDDASIPLHIIGAIGGGMSGLIGGIEIAKITTALAGTASGLGIFIGAAIGLYGIFLPIFYANSDSRKAKKELAEFRQYIKLKLIDNYQANTKKA